MEDLPAPILKEIVEMSLRGGPDDVLARLSGCAVSCTALRDAVALIGESWWKSAVMRTSPLPIARAGQVVITPFTDLGACAFTADAAAFGVPSFESHYKSRARAARVAASNTRSGGYSLDIGECCLMNDRTCCTLAAALPSDPFTLNDITFTFELFEDAAQRQSRMEMAREIEEDCEEAPGFEYLTPAMIAGHVGPPHLSGSSENLVWAGSVAGAAMSDGCSVKCTVPIETNASGKRHYVTKGTIPLDVGCEGGDEWLRPYR